MTKRLTSILPFRVWNHMFLCKRSHPCKGMCRYCTKSYIASKKISDHINKKLYIQTEKFIPSLQGEIDRCEKINIDVHTNIFLDKDDPPGVIFHYESISSPFLIWKMYLDIFCTIAFNVSEKFLLSVFISSVRGFCRNFTICTNKICPGLKTKVIKVMFYKTVVEFCLYLSCASCELVNSDFTHNVYKTYQKERDLLNCFLEFGRNE